MARRRCPECGGGTLSGVAPSYYCMDCECEFTIKKTGQDLIASISGKQLPVDPPF